MQAEELRQYLALRFLGLPLIVNIDVLLVYSLAMHVWPASIRQLDTDSPHSLPDCVTHKYALCRSPRFAAADCASWVAFSTSTKPPATIGTMSSSSSLDMGCPSSRPGMGADAAQVLLKSGAANTLCIPCVALTQRCWRREGKAAARACLEPSGTRHPPPSTPAPVSYRWAAPCRTPASKPRSSA